MSAFEWLILGLLAWLGVVLIVNAVEWHYAKRGRWMDER